MIKLLSLRTLLLLLLLILFPFTSYADHGLSICPSPQITTYKLIPSGTICSSAQGCVQKALDAKPSTTSNGFRLDNFQLISGTVTAHGTTASGEFTQNRTNTVTGTSSNVNGGFINVQVELICSDIEPKCQTPTLGWQKVNRPNTLTLGQSGVLNDSGTAVMCITEPNGDIAKGMLESA